MSLKMWAKTEVQYILCLSVLKYELVQRGLQASLGICNKTFFILTYSHKKITKSKTFSDVWHRNKPLSFQTQNLTTKSFKPQWLTLRDKK